MSPRAIVRHGDRTTHGGTVISADSASRILGRGVARVGDSVTCPRCKGPHWIVSGAPDFWSGQSIARHGDTTDCGAKLIASQSQATIEEGPPAAAALDDLGPGRTTPMAEEPAVQESSHAIRFRAVDPQTGAPSPDCVYILTREDGTQHGGITDADGYTEIVEAPRRERIAVHFLFRTPRGQAIEREDLEA